MTEPGGKPHLLHKRSQYGYTESPFNAMAGDAGEAVPPAFQKQLTTEAHDRRASEREDQDKRDNARSAFLQMKQLEAKVRKKGGDPTVVLLEAKAKLEAMAG